MKNGGILLGLSLLLMGCPQARGRQGLGVVPGRASVGYTCDLARMGAVVEGVGEVRAVYLTWLEGSSSSRAVVLVSDDHFAERDSAVTLVLDGEQHRVDQVRDRFGKALQYDLKARYMSLDEALAQIHARVGQLLLENAPRAIIDAPSGVDAAEFPFDGNSFQVSRREALAQVENYGPVPGIVRSGGAPVCEFLGYLKRDGLK